MPKDQIEKLAGETFEKGGGAVPVPIVRIAQKLGLQIYEMAMPKMNESVPSGILTQMENKWVVILNQDDSPTRKRFTVAHEIGHFLLHKGRGFIDDFSAGETFYRNVEENQTLEIEKEANLFAAAVLMPEQKLKEIWPSCNNPAEAAEKFNVSEVSMTYRLKNLGLISC